MASANSRLLGCSDGGSCGMAGRRHIQLGRRRFFAANEVVENVHWHGEDDSGVVLGGYTAQRLKVAELWYGREEKF